MNAAIVGATGLIGQHLLIGLLQQVEYKTVYVIGRRLPEWFSEHHKTKPRFNNSQPLSSGQINKLVFIQAELDEFPQVTLPEFINHAYCCLGTTIKKAGSQTQFIKVDKTAVIDFAHMILRSAEYLPDSAREQHFKVVTAIGADPDSKIFYNKVKGEVQQSLMDLPLAEIYFYQPSLLIGKRDEHRFLEALGQSVFNVFSGVFVGPLQQYKPITAQAVANAMLLHTETNPERFQVISNKQMHQLYSTE
ncbi:nucleoside-diphosphate sugar epimerase [Shewanella maritima]|uniref:nucleoside-diphosphate sugar epimerase n=1 Tax=Shewanella maritima TaxID=2520507 RepID=UPI003735A874